MKYKIKLDVTDKRRNRRVHLYVDDDLNITVKNRHKGIIFIPSLAELYDILTNTNNRFILGKEFTVAESKLPEHIFNRIKTRMLIRNI